MNKVSLFILPFVILFIIFYGYFKKENIYDDFLDGVKDGIKIVINIVPAIIAMSFAVNIFVNSNFISFLFLNLKPFFNIIGFPIEVLPMAILRPISGTATLNILNDLFLKYGPDSYIGFLSSTIQGCTDTTLYVIALYFSYIKIKKTRYAIPVGLFADLIGIISAVIVVSIFFK